MAEKGIRTPLFTTYDTLDGRTFEGVVLSSVGHAQAERSAFDTAKLHPTLLEDKTPLTDPLKKQLNAPFGSYLWFKQVEEKALEEGWQELAEKAAEKEPRKAPKKAKPEGK